MPKLNASGAGVLFTGALTALLQFFVASNSGHTSVTTLISALLTILVGLHGALTNSIFAKSKGAHAADRLVSEGEQILNNVGEK